jgi:hypothetical protein
MKRRNVLMRMKRDATRFALIGVEDERREFAVKAMSMWHRSIGVAAVSGAEADDDP